MEITNFIEHFANIFDEENTEISNTTSFHDLEEWSSLSNLSLIAMIDEVYGVSISGADINMADTVQDLFEIVKSKVDNK